MIFRGSYALTDDDKALKAAIARMGQDKVAEAAGLSESSVSRWMNGKRYFKESTARRVVEAVGMDWNRVSKNARSG